MRITLLQTDITWASPHLNIGQAEEMIDAAPPSDLYVLPEMWSTGFATSPEGIAETDGLSLKWMKTTAQRCHAAISGSIATALPHHGGYSYLNRHYFVRPDGSHEQYDKRHLFSYGGEHLCYTRGENRCVATYGGWRWLLLVCYDLRFPVWSRYRGDYDGIIIVANWPETRQAVWDTLLKARAIENQCYVVAVNRTGSDSHNIYAGGSRVIDAKGKVVAECALHEACTATADIDIGDLLRFREKFRVLDDRDTFDIPQ